jgi:iron complex transport system permease protein
VSRAALAWPLATLALLAAVLAALATGRFPLAPAALWRLASGAETDPAVLAVFWNVRAPRVVAALLVGGALAAAGAAFQAMFRNPLAAPDLLGVTAGASLGAVLGIFIGLPVPAIQALAFAGGILAVLGVTGLAAAVRGQGDPVLVLLLAGIALAALLGAGIALLKVLADPYNQLPAITFWLLGTLAATTRGDLLAALLPAAAGLGLLMLLRWRLNLLTLSEDEARALGVNPTLLRGLAIAGATLATASVTALAGGVGWVGLIVPHMARLLGGPDLRRLLPLSLLLGAAFLLGVDTLARSAGRTEVPLGVLTALLGTPLFLWLLARGR